MTGSWAGAFGQTQFMPSTFLELAVDFDGDGRRDLVNSVPDALASTANFLDKRGYRTGELGATKSSCPVNFGQRLTVKTRSLSATGAIKVSRSPMAVHCQTI